MTTVDSFESGGDMWRVERREVFVLYRNGASVYNGTCGETFTFADIAEARHMAKNWEVFRAPTFAELSGMPDNEVLRRAGKTYIVGERGPELLF